VNDLVDHIARHGPVSFGRFVDAALYGPDGFYSRGRGPGTQRDFVTSPEVGALFGAVMARALDSWWDDLGRVDPFVVVEPGAGPGGLIAAILAAEPNCASALRWLLVERSVGMRELQRTRRLPLVDVTQIMGVLRHEPDDDEDATFLRGQGPLVAQLAELPLGAEVHVIVANELLDNMPFDVAVMQGDGWAEVRVDVVADGRADGRFTEIVVPGSDALSQYCERYAGPVPIGTRIPVQSEARRWLIEALASVSRGRIVLIDYGASTTELAYRPNGQWLRVYRDHRRSFDPMLAPGSSDITTDVATDQLFAVSRPTLFRTQAEFLRAHGIDEIVENAVVVASKERPGSLAALRRMSFVSERETLLDPDGLGGFLVMEWVR
jgi:SAM-dependent MidA family methyltransferase